MGQRYRPLRPASLGLQGPPKLYCKTAKIDAGNFDFIFRCPPSFLQYCTYARTDQRVPCQYKPDTIFGPSGRHQCGIIAINQTSSKTRFWQRSAAQHVARRHAPSNHAPGNATPSAASNHTASASYNATPSAADSCLRPAVRTISKKRPKLRANAGENADYRLGSRHGRI